FTFMRFLYARYQRSLPLREVSVNVVETLSLFEVLRKIYRQTYTLFKTSGYTMDEETIYAALIESPNRNRTLGELIGEERKE
ncbi:MAG: hypothetical protein ACRC5C_14145, partial [Bacilli bacterium]